MDATMFSLVPEQFDLTDWLMFEAPIQLDEKFNDESATPSSTSSPSQYSGVADSSSKRMQLQKGIPGEPALELIWLEESQTHSDTRPKRKIAPRSKESVPTVNSCAASPTSSLVDSHSEACCSKCRITETEARKCRLERRREQNRASQRKFRARKEAKIRDAVQQVSALEVYVEFLEKQNDDLEAANGRIFQQLEDLKKSYEVTVDPYTSPCWLTETT